MLKTGFKHKEYEMLKSLVFVVLLFSQGLFAKIIEVKESAILADSYTDEICVIKAKDLLSTYLGAPQINGNTLNTTADDYQAYIYCDLTNKKVDLHLSYFWTYQEQALYFLDAFTKSFQE